MYITERFKENLPTNLRFYEDSYKKEISTFVDFIVIHEKFGLSLVLSDTIFYPQGGGQKGDRGFIEVPDNIARDGIPKKVYIKDTKKEGLYVFHVIENTESIDINSIKEYLYGERVELHLDWNFRFKQMRLHSIAHLLHFFTESAYGKKLDYPISSNLQEDFGVNKYDLNFSFNDEKIQNIIEDFQKFISENHKIITYPDEKKQGFRYWHCNNYIVPCGGSHLSNTLEIGKFDMDVSSKKGQTSIKFLLK